MHPLDKVNPDILTCIPEGNIEPCLIRSLQGLLWAPQNTRPHSTASQLRPQQNR